MQENIEEKLIDINDEVFDSRITVIKEQLQKIILEKRNTIDESKNNEELLSDDIFKSWIICNEIYKMIETNESFSRLFYFMHGHYNGDITKVISNYDVEFIKDDNNNISSINLITLEEDYG